MHSRGRTATWLQGAWNSSLYLPNTHLHTPTHSQCALCILQANFSIFFDTTGRRKCCLAPERFYDSDSAESAAPGAPAALQAWPLTEAMDVFAMGCTLAELFREGQPLFDYSSVRGELCLGRGGGK
jgi:hypothetical protein